MNEPSLLPLAWRLARRELRSGLHGFGVFLTCLFLGVFAVSAVGSFTSAARSGLLSDARALLGGDLEIRQPHRELPREQEAFVSKAGVLSKILEMRAMARTPENDRRILVELKAVDAAYPLYGQLITEPEKPRALAFQGSLRDPGALVEESLLQRLDLKVGDTLHLGQATFRIAGTLQSEPDRTIRAFTLGPRLMISQESLPATGLLVPGSLVTYAYRLRLPPEADAEIFRRSLQERFPDAGWRLRTYRQAAPRVRFFLDRMATNLTLIGLCALLIGGLGVAGAVRGYLGGKVFHIAAMKCVGASGNTIFTAYLMQVLVLGTIGAGAGVSAGAVVPYLAHWFIGDRIPVPLLPGIFPAPLMTAALFGLLIAVVFSLKALGIAKRIPPSVLFRGYSDHAGLDPGGGIRIAIAIATLALAVLAIATSGDRRLALWFTLGAGTCFFIFRFLAAVIIAAARKAPKPRQPALRLGLANIHRRGSPAASTIFSIGLGLTALVVVALVQANLSALVEKTVPKEAPAYFFIDIQNEQVQEFERIALQVPGVDRMERHPTLRGRITAIDGIPVGKASISPEVAWAVRGDRFLSYTTSRPADTELTAGSWWPDDYRGPPRISLTDDLAKGFSVGIGDTLTVNVLGRDITAEIANLRHVDWSTLDLNFAILLSPGVLEGAPQTHIATVYSPPQQDEVLLRTVTDRFPNISAIGIREVLHNVSRTLDRIAGAFTAMAAVALATGFLVLAGAVSADQHRRIHDAVIFKVCGATRGDILAAFAAEFLILGLGAGLVASLVGSLAAMGIVKGLMNTGFSLHIGTVTITLAAGITLTLVLGLTGTWKALGKKPAEYLREID